LIKKYQLSEAISSAQMKIGMKRLKNQGFLKMAKNWRAILAGRNEVEPYLPLLSFLVH
jgi:hypothetical protein